jgi:hypothetical protein
MRYDHPGTSGRIPPTGKYAAAVPGAISQNDGSNCIITHPAYAIPFNITTPRDIYV